MEHLYLIEIFLDKVTIVEDEEDARTDKKLVTKIKFGPKVEFIIKEEPLAVNKKVEDVIERDGKGKKQWTRSIRVGKSYLFSSYSDNLVRNLTNFPLEIEIWNDDDQEKNIFVGSATMTWDTDFFNILKESASVCDPVEPLSIKQRATLSGECCKPRVGEIQLILRLRVMGNSIITDFQELMDDPDTFVFRTDKTSSTFSCKRIEGDNPEATLIGSIYETTMSEEAIKLSYMKKMKVCTKLKSCGIAVKGTDYACEDEVKKKYPIDKIRFGDIAGPCGSTGCKLAQKVRAYLRKQDSYKKNAEGVCNSKHRSKKVCGGCVCKDDRHHRKECPVHEGRMTKMKDKAVCCGSQLKDHTCTDNHILEGDDEVSPCHKCIKKGKDRRKDSDDKTKDTFTFLLRLDDELDDYFINDPPHSGACCVSESNKTKRLCELDY